MNLPKKWSTALDAKGGRISFTFSNGRRGILVEKVRPTLRNPATGIRLGEYVICKSDKPCWDFQHDPMPRNPSDSFGALFDSYGLQTHRYLGAEPVDVPHVDDPETDADGEPELTLDFSHINDLRPIRPVYDAVCAPLPKPHGNFLNTVVVEDRPAPLPGVKPYTERFLCQSLAVQEAERASLNARYLQMLELTADACKRGKVEIPGSRVLNRKAENGPGRMHGLGVIDTGTNRSN